MGRVHHLAVAFPQFELARHPARGAERQRALDPGGVGEEEDELHVARLVLDEDPRRGAGAGRRHAVLGDAHFERDDGVEGRLGDLRPVAPIDRAGRHVEQQVEHARAVGRPVEQPVEHLEGLRSDARQVGGGREERVEAR